MVELPDSARLHGRYTLAPGEENRSSVKELPADFAVVVVISRDEAEIISYVTAHCDGDLVFLDVTLFEYGPGSAYNCEGGLF
ncbi:hypothetical protein ACFQH3_20100 [Haladaptatus sp. GCM10025707]|uniref:hypothetical protein n=1 Tax=unclassified Haladaptatus TaxID=2622732 RepID=UPI0023E7A632|nr:hypothetical protein [Haladaptatus sp. QDMS2]